MSLSATPSQTVGPYFRIGLSWAYRRELFDDEGEARQLTIEGQLHDGDGQPIGDGLLELWQADPEGRFPSADAPSGAVRGFGRVATEPDGRFCFRTLRPGLVAGADGALQAPHISVIVSMRGLLKPVRTRIYFPEQRANTHDPVLGLVPPERRHTLIAVAIAERTLRWDIFMQGDRETVFFDY